MAAALFRLLSFFFPGTATAAIYTLSLHDALPIFLRHRLRRDLLAAMPPDDVVENVADVLGLLERGEDIRRFRRHRLDRKSTRLNSSHVRISYAVFCLKKKKHQARGRRNDASFRRR